MKKYRVDLKVTGFIEVLVEAESANAAMDKAADQFDLNTPVADLQYKYIDPTLMGETE